MTNLDLMQQLQNALAECERLRTENTHLRSLLHIKLECKDQKPIPESTSISLSTQEKIKLFRSLFHGREDVYAIRWESKNGKTGYSPALENKWNTCHCKKPKIRCAICNQDKLLSITDQVIHDHLSGKYMVGIYPLLRDEICWFLAIDFDKSGWQEDAVAFYKTAQSFSIPIALERSQSGNGAHCWIFFDQPVPAYLARQLGCALLTQVMQERHQLNLNSYDRLFPSQDTMPKGGFGNLIALPLQGLRRKVGNSIFLDGMLQPYSDQWAFLLSLKKMNYHEVSKLVRLLADKSGIIDVRKSQIDETVEDDPWITAARKSNKIVITTPLPTSVNITIANLVYVETGNLPPALINQLKKLAAFQNPEFYKAQAMRLSTYGKSRIISCAVDYPKHIGLPRGCLQDIVDLLTEYKIKTNVCDETYTGQIIDVNFSGKLYPKQQEAVKELIKHSNGVLAATTAFGKTVVAANIISRRKTNTLILLHRQQLMDQWRERLSMFLDIPMKDIGVIGGGKLKPTGKIDVAMLQSLFRDQEVNEIVANYGQVIVDECHHISAFSFEQVMKAVKAKYVLGLTATPIRKDGHHPIILMQCGAIRYRAINKNSMQSSLKYIAKIRYTSFTMPSLQNNFTIQDIYAALIVDEIRNEFILNDILQSLEKKRSPLLLTERTQHLEWFAEKLKNFAKNIIILKGGLGKKRQRMLNEQLKSIPDDEERIILATGRYIGEGFDDARLDTLFLAMPISWQGTLQQYVGRLHRNHHAKQDVIVYDYVDSNIAMLVRMYEKRIKKYRAIGYVIE